MSERSPAAQLAAVRHPCQLNARSDTRRCQLFSVRTLSIMLFAASLLVACGTSTPTVTASTVVPTEQLLPSTVQPTLELPTSEPTDPPSVAEPTTASPTQPGAPLGLSRSDAAIFFKFLEFNFELSQTPSGEDDFAGTVSDGLATVHILGPEGAVTSVSVVIDVSTPPSENQSARTIAYLAAVLSVAAEDWSEGTQWLNESMNVMGESRISFDSREAILILEPGADSMHVELTIAATP